MAASPEERIASNTNWQHLSDELELLNACLLRELRLRTINQQQGQLDQLQGLVLNDREVAAFLNNESVPTHIGPDAHDLEERISEIENRINQRRSEYAKSATQLSQLTSMFQLDRNEERCVVLSLAAEIDSNYSKVFAFLQDDLTKKQPSIDLALRLLSQDLFERIEYYSIFSPTSSLLKNRLLHLSEPAGRHAPFTQLTLKLDDRITAFLLRIPQVEECLIDWVNLVSYQHEVCPAVNTAIRDQTIHLVERCFSGGEAPVRPLIHLYGRPGSGRRSLAAYASHRIGLPLLVADVKRMPNGSSNTVDILWRLARESMLLPAVILIENFDDLLAEEKCRERAALLEALRIFSPLTFLSGTQPWKAERPAALFLSLECKVPDATTRLHYWHEHLKDGAHDLGADDLIELSSKFNFTEGQIRQTVEAARCHAFWENDVESQLNVHQLSQASRTVATPSLKGLARKIESGYAWSDIVLPETELLQLREIVAHVKRSQVVFEQWGFAGKFSYGKGVTALFEGSSGTGKTMGASIIAAGLDLDLYRIDLSSVVSKYIGETEKNLERIFTEAQDTNAILFFDEGDALFGKRSDVKDAHDRYANIETAYLLQRMEDYSGIVIIATNMKQNVDDAFVRRMRFIVRFPFPTEDDRESIWQKVFPASAPLRDIDFSWLARNLKITGGNIKNIGLRAAFLAIERQGAIGMDCVIDAAKLEMEKIGMISTLAEFHPPMVEPLRVAEVA